MANPTITNNSPQAGSISWTAFGIAYNGQTFNVPAGNSAKKFVWWLYGGGTAPALQEGDTLPNLGPDDMILFLNKGGVGVLVPATDMLEGSLIVNGSILAPAIAANEIQTYHLAANSVTANQIAANSVSSQDIQAGAITTDKLAVGTVGDSLVTNGSFEEFDAAGMPIGWRSVVTPTNGSLAIVTGIASSGTNALRLQSTVAANCNVRIEQTPEKFIPVSATAGRKWYVSARYGAGTATTNGAYFRVTWYDANKAYVSSNDVLSNAALPTTFTIAEGQVTPPAAARYMGISLLLVNASAATSMYVDEVIAREVIVSAIIADGAITTPKMTANSISGDRIQAGTLTATQIGANSITADKLIVSDFTNYAQDGNFQDASKRSWTGSGTIVTSTTEPNKLKVVTAASGNNDQSNIWSFNVAPGEQYYGEMWVYGETTNVGNGGPNLHLAVRRDDGTTTWPTFQSLTRAAVQGAWTKLSGFITIPANGRTAKVEPAVGFSSDAVGNIYYFRQIQVRRMGGGELIVDGTITALELATDSVTSDKILANNIISSKIAANAIQANHIAANAIQANHLIANAIDGKTIRGATVIGGEVKTTDVANAISARMGPTAVYALDGSTTYPGIGFVQEGNTAGKRIAGLFSVNGPDVTLTQGGDLAYAENQAYLQLSDDIGKLYARQSIDITGRNGMNIASQVGGVTISGNQIDLRPVNGLLVNGVDMTAGEVQVWDYSGSIANNQIPVVKLGGYASNAILSTSTAVGTVDATPGIRVTNAGVYDIHATYGESGGFGSPDSRNFLEIGVTNGANSGALLARAAFSYQEDSVSVTATGVKLAAGDIVKLEALQNSGGTRTYVGKLRLKRVAGPVPVTSWGNGDQSLTGNVTATGNVVGNIRHWEGYNSSFAVAGNAQWDSGPVTYDAANSTDNNVMCKVHSVPGSVWINETGWYMVDLYLTPASNPGQGHMHLNYVNGGSNNLISRFATVVNNANTFETFLSTGPLKLTAGNYLRSELLYQFDHNVYSRWRIHKIEN